MIDSISKVLKELKSDRMGFIGLTMLISIVLFSAVGSLIYNVDPDTVFFDNVFSIYFIKDENTVESVTIEIQNLNVSFIDIEPGILVFGSDELIKIIDLDGYREKTVELNSDLGMLTFLEVIRADTDRYLIYLSFERGAISVFEASLLGADISVSNIKNIDINYVLKQIEAVDDGDVLIGVDIYNRIIFIDLDTQTIKAVANVGFDVNAISACLPNIYVAGAGGYLAIVNAESSKVTMYRPIYEELLSIDTLCDQNTAVAVGKFGSIAIYRDGKVSSIITGIVEDLYDVKYSKDRKLFIAGGKDGVILGIDPFKETFYTLDIDAVDSDIKILFPLKDRSIVAASFGTYVRALKPPSIEHPFGTTYYGRDLLAQVLEGIRTSLFIGLVIALAVEAIGFLIGLVAGYFGGKVDRLTTSIINFMYSIPLEPFAIMLAIIYRPSLTTVIVAITLLIWRTTARIIRSQVIQVSNTPMIESVKALGAGHIRILLKHVAPAVMPLALLDFATVIAYAILAESTLSFLGVGSQELYTLGNILNRARITGAWREAWWTTLIPGIFITLIVLSIYMVIRSLEKIYNPRLSTQF